MKNTQSFGLLAVAVFAVGMAGLNLSDGTIVIGEQSAPMANTAGLMGHIEVIHTDSEGNILSYQQTDNTITNKGVNCMVKELFGATQLDTNNCQGTLTNNWTTIALEKTATMASALNAQSNSTVNVATESGLTPATGTATVTTAAVTSGGTTGATVRISNTFSAGESATIYGASLTNSTDANTNGLFAYKDFSTQIALNSGDDLTVNWDITLTGGGAES